MINIRKLETELWEAADLLRADSKVTSQEYCMPVLGLIFLRYAYSRFKFVEGEILKNRPMRNGRVAPVEAEDFKYFGDVYEKMIYDISLSEMGVAPTAAEIPLMIAYYLSDLIFGLLIYLGSLAAVWFTLKDQD